MKKQFVKSFKMTRSKRAHRILTIALCLALLLAFCSCTNNKTKELYKGLEGEYTDSFSQRAIADIVSKDKYVEILVSWGSSAAEKTVWIMTATLDGDNKLSYTDCEEAIIIFDEKGNSNKTVLKENLSGYFTIQDGKLFWDGSEDPQCSECIFEKNIY